MHKFFNPGAVAIVGASTKNLGNFVVKNLLNGFNGGVYPVNSNYTEIDGIPCYPSITAIEDPVDMAIVLVPPEAVPSVLEGCAEKGIYRVIIESAGFSETGEAGIELQKKCTDIAERAGIRVWGPNCMGLVDIHRKHFFTFMHPSVREEDVLPGHISLIVQSGMMSAIFLSELGRRGIGVAKACSIGNRADVDECDLIEYLQDDPDTQVIALYLESIPRGRRFALLAENSAKPIVLLKGGQSSAGAAAAMSHTYSLSGNSRLLNSVLKLSGTIMADGIYQMMDMANALSMAGRVNPACRTVILTLSGGAGILACDALEKSGIPIALLSEATKQEISQVFPPWMPVFNPIDLFPAVARNGRMVAFECAFSAALKDPAVDALVIHFVAGLEAEMPDFQDLRKRADQSGKVVAFWLMGRREGSLQFREQARTAGIQVHDDATRIAECLKAIAEFTAHRQDCPATDGISEPLSLSTTHAELPEAGTTWDEYDSKRFLSGFGIPVVEEILVDGPDPAWTAAQQMGLPVVLKGLAPDQAHKTEHGLVKLGITDADHLQSAYGQLRHQLNENGRILLQKQVDYDYELIAGFLRDEHFGACVMFGIGGILAELEPDVMFAMAPLNIGKAIKLINSIRNRRLLHGFRGMAPIDIAAMAKILVNLGEMGTSHPQIGQIDINPLVVSAGSPMAVDANIIFASNDQTRTGHHE